MEQAERHTPDHDDQHLEPYEREHLATVRAGAPQSMVLLASDGSFPLTHPGPVALFGAGARHTVKGGTGSGDVNSRRVVTIEEGLTRAGFTITTTGWLDAYDRLAAAHHADFVADIKARAKQAGVPAIVFGMGAVEPALDHDLPLSEDASVPDGDGDSCEPAGPARRSPVAVYVLARDSGEGNDRHPEPGDVMLTASEVRDIRALAEQYETFLLVLNVGGVVDLSPVKDVPNILLLSQLGATTGDSLADVLLGRAYPSGHLSTTWAAWEDYPAVGDFGDPDDTHYREGVYVGYRYLDSVGAEPLFPFGHGLGWTTFALGDARAALDGADLTVTVPVTNTGRHPGREVVQVYVSVPSGTLDQPYQALAGFTKTDELAPGATATVDVHVDLTDLASFDPARAATVLEQGSYLVRVGTSSRATTPVAVVDLPSDAVVRQLHDALGEPGFTDWKPESPVAVVIPDGLPHLTVEPAALRRPDTTGQVDLTDAAAFVADLSDDELTYLVLGHYPEHTDAQSVIGQACQDLVGAAGQTSTRLRDRGLGTLVMPDGPAGLRLATQVGVDADGPFPIDGAHVGLFGDLMDEESLAALGADPGAPQRVPESVYEQWATAIPIGTAIAQAWNPELARAYGDLVGAEMEHFGAHLWLAPAMNLHRSILCGRNFEYLSEDPLLAGRTAAGITRGVQSHPGRGVTLKHFAFNNQETNRFNSCSHVSQRAARDLYLRGFEIAVREAGPHAVMTSYNLVNGVHTSQSSDLLETILRQEWGFAGLVMTDWVVAGFARTDAPWLRATASATVAAGNELFMPGSEADRQDLLAALADGRLTRERLEQQAARVVRMVRLLAH